MPEPIEVVHVVGRMGHGGVESWLMHVLRHIDREQFHFTFCTLSGREGAFDEEIRVLGADVFPCPLSAGPWKFAGRFTSFLKRIGCDVLHSHVLYATGWLLKLGAKAGVPIRIAHGHTAGDSRPRTTLRWLYSTIMRRYIDKYATYGLACSAKAADFLYTDKWRERKDRQVLFYGIDTVQCSKTMDRKTLCDALGIPPGSNVVGHVGSFRPVKNHSFLLKVAAAMIRKRSNVRLVLVGDGPLRRRTERLAEDLGISKHVTFAGVRSNVPELMRNVFDVLLLPSRFEGLPVVTLEAQCAGLACLVSDTITAEIIAIPRLVHYESLEAEPEVWAERAIGIIESPAYGREQALKEIEAGKFSIAWNVSFLTELYSGRSGV